MPHSFCSAIFCQPMMLESICHTYAMAHAMPWHMPWFAIARYGMRHSMCRHAPWHAMAFAMVAYAMVYYGMCHLCHGRCQGQLWHTPWYALA